MYKVMSLKSGGNGYPATKAAFDAFAHEVVSLDSALERVGKGALLERKAHCDVVLSALRSHPILAASVAQFRLTSQKIRAVSHVNLIKQKHSFNYFKSTQSSTKWKSIISGDGDIDIAKSIKWMIKLQITPTL